MTMKGRRHLLQAAPWPLAEALDDDDDDQSIFPKFTSRGKQGEHSVTLLIAARRQRIHQHQTLFQTCYLYFLKFVFPLEHTLLSLSHPTLISLSFTWSFGSLWSLVFSELFTLVKEGYPKKDCLFWGKLPFTKISPEYMRRNKMRPGMSERLCVSVFVPIGETNIRVVRALATELRARIY